MVIVVHCHAHVIFPSKIVFEYLVKENEIVFRWNNCVPRFNMPLKILVAGKPVIVKPSTGWTTIKSETPAPDVEVDKDYYVASMNMMGIK